MFVEAPPPPIPPTPTDICLCVVCPEANDMVVCLGGGVGVKLERVGSDYNPRDDSCIKAYVRLMAQVAQDDAEEV